MGSAHAKVQLAGMIEEGKIAFDKYRMLDLYKSASDQGDPVACFIIGITYEDGEFINKDIEKSIFYYERGMNLGHSGCAKRLGEIYLGGYGVPKSNESAAKYFSIASRLGCIGSTFSALRLTQNKSERKDILLHADGEKLRSVKKGIFYALAFVAFCLFLFVALLMLIFF